MGVFWVNEENKSVVYCACSITTELRQHMHARDQPAIMANQEAAIGCVCAMTPSLGDSTWELLVLLSNPMFLDARSWSTCVTGFCRERWHNWDRNVKVPMCDCATIASVQEEQEFEQTPIGTETGKWISRKQAMWDISNKIKFHIHRCSYLEMIYTMWGHRWKKWSLHWGAPNDPSFYYAQNLNFEWSNQESTSYDVY